MTPEAINQLLAFVKAYARIDYDDDDGVLLPIMIEATCQTMAEIIPGFSPESITPRQQVCLGITVKNLYDQREKYGTAQDRLRAAAASILTSEMYEPKGANLV